MNYDGIFIKAQTAQINNAISNEHISKVTMRSFKELDLHIRKNAKNLIFSLVVEPNFPHIMLKDMDIDNLPTPPTFCMLIRKYLQSGLIKKVTSGNPFINGESSLERIINIEVENINESGDVCTYHLFVEIMGRYSNIILTDDKYQIIDVLIKSDKSDDRLKIKNIYNVENICSKKEILSESDNGFKEILKQYKTLCDINDEKYSIKNAIIKNYSGISSKSININEDADIDLNDIKKEILSKIKSIDDANVILNEYLIEKSLKNNDSTEKKNVEDIIKNLYTKLAKKLDNYKKDLSKCENLDIYKKYGDLIAAYGYIETNVKEDCIICEDFNNGNQKISIPIDKNISISENINKYYEKYNKLKRTKENAEKLMDEAREKIEHLDAISSTLSYSNDKNDIYLIKEELIKYFDESNKIYSLKKQINNGKSRTKYKNSKLNYNIHHYKSSDGIDIYVGKNNLQNEYLTFTIASPNDTWLHIKNAVGAHVIIKKPYEELSDKTITEAASLAAYYSEKKNETKATVDYTLRKELKKVKGKAPGFCIYHKNYSINVRPEITLKEI